MKELLLVNYNIHATEQVRIDGRDGFRDKDYIYFIISSNNKEMIHIEQAALAYYLSENGYKHTAIPIPAINNNWFVQKDNNLYMVLRLAAVQQDPGLSHGKKLAEFHQKTAEYSYEPQEISSYGHWKDLWIKKLTAFERKIEHDSATFHHNFYRLLIDIFPYLIGVSENAIQYMQESEAEKRFHQGDQGVFTFQRYYDNLQQPVIWTDDLVYDHPTRDIAEFIRNKFLKDTYNVTEIRSFLAEYQELRPLSVFSWRILFARLLYPIHFFDLIEESFKKQDFDQSIKKLNQLIKKQEVYEKRLSKFFELADVDYERYDIPVIQWML